MQRATFAILGILVGLGLPAAADAGCGCDKPPPPRAAIRPFVAHADAEIILFSDQLSPRRWYDVEFVPREGTSDWSRGRAVRRADLADGARRAQLRVRVPGVALGPCRLNVWFRDRLLYTLADDQFTVTSRPVALYDSRQDLVFDDYRAGVGSDGTVYLAVDVSGVSDATTFVARAVGYPLSFGSDGVAIYNAQGFLMQLLDPRQEGLFRIGARDGAGSTRLSYWRHEFQTYKREHRQLDARLTDAGGDWHRDGTRHVDHDHLVVAITGTLPGGARPTPGSTEAFRLEISSTRAPSSPLR